MRKSGAIKEGEFVRIFDNEDFGYHRITVERPLKLNFSATDERLERVKEAKPFQNLAASKKRKNAEVAAKEVEAGKEKQDQILKALESLRPLGVVKNREQWLRAMKKAGINEPAALTKAILIALAERDETADVCTDKKGNPEPDPELRDYENVPHKDDIESYMKKEVLPFVHDAWVDETKTKVGYEINLNRYFYQYTPPRPLEEIEADLRQIEKEIADMLAEMTS